jgi:hypothetical protein
MLQLCLNSLAGIALVLTMLANAHALPVYSESVNGDLSGSGLSPTVITLAEGFNEIVGTTGQSGGVSDRDYFTVTVPTNLKLAQLIEEAGTEAGQSGAFARGFLGLQSGTQVTLATNTVTATGLLGWTHYVPTPTDIDILPAMGIAANGSTGFVPPLGPGTYAFWLQDTTPGTFNYRLNLVLVPEPSAGALMIMGCFALWGFSRRRRA